MGGGLNPITAYVVPEWPVFGCVPGRLILITDDPRQRFEPIVESAKPQKRLSDSPAGRIQPGVIPAEILQLEVMGGHAIMG